MAVYIGRPNWALATGPFVEGESAFGLPPLDPPPGERLTGGIGVRDEDGQPREYWLTEPMTLEEAIAERVTEAAVVFEDQRQRPMAWDFGQIAALDDEDQAQGPAGVQTLQMRDTGDVDDVKNWLSAQAGAMTAVVLGQGAMVLPIKVTSNLWVQTTAAQLLQVLISGDGAQLSMLQRGVLQLKAFGAVKRAIRDAGHVGDALAVDLLAGYPPVDP